MTDTDLEELLRRARPGTSHRDAPLTDRALRELADLEPSTPTQKRTPRRRARVAIWRTASLTAVAAVAVAVTVGTTSVQAQSAQAVTTLHTAAANSTARTDGLVGLGQYLKVSTHAQWMRDIVDPDGTTHATTSAQTIDVYQPYDISSAWWLVRDWGEGHEPEILTANNGEFYGTPYLPMDLTAIPTGTGRQVLDYFDSQYTGGSASRDEDDFVRITDLLKTGLIPAELRARLYDALALIPGVTSTAGVANLDGQVGTAIGRTEPLRGGLRQEIIIDPATGLVIGDRQIHTVAILGFGTNEIVALTAITTTVVGDPPR